MGAVDQKRYVALIEPLIQRRGFVATNGMVKFGNRKAVLFDNDKGLVDRIHGRNSCFCQRGFDVERNKGLVFEDENRAPFTATLDLALQASALDQAEVDCRPRLLSDNGPSYVAADLSDWLEGQGMKHTRGKPYHPMMQGKIERWHLSLKSRILLENYYLPGDPDRAVADFVEHYNHRRYHESLGNLTPADVYFGRGDRILKRREDIKRRTIDQRRRHHFNAAA